MISKRILIVSHAPLSAQFGAGQVAMNLSTALQLEGCHVVAWTPKVFFKPLKWWKTLRIARKELNELLAQKDFDVIDIPPILITSKVRKIPLVIARSVQPYILYLMAALYHNIAPSIKGVLQLVSRSLELFVSAFLIFQGWAKADYILCLGSLETERMKMRFPCWRNKIISYTNAPSDEDHKHFLQIRLKRKELLMHGIRFLWIGRWAYHKGVDILLEFIKQRFKKYPDDTLTIAGCGSLAEEGRLKEVIRSGRIKIIPTFDRKELYEILTNHDMGLFTSRVEGWGLSLNEMLESGMPVFATNVGGVPDMKPFFQKTLMKFPPPLQLDENYYDSEEDLNKYLREFNWETITKKYLQTIGYENRLS